MVGAGLPFAVHVRFAVMPAVINVDFFIDSFSFRDIEARNVKKYRQNYILIITSMKNIAKFPFFTCAFNANLLGSIPRFLKGTFLCLLIKPN